MKYNTNRFCEKDKVAYKSKVTKKMKIQAVICFVLIFLVFECVKFIVIENIIENKKNTTKYNTTIAFDMILNNMGIIKAKLDSLVAYTIDSEENISNFESAASSLIGEEYILSIALVPKGGIEYIYPSLDKEVYYGYDFYDKNIQNNQEMLKDTKNDTKNNISTVISGPYMFDKGGKYILIRVPVLLDDEYAASELWGFAYAYISFPDSISEEGLSFLESQNYNYKIYRNDIYNDEKVIFNHNKNNIENGIILQYEIFNQTWDILVEPGEGWYNKKDVLFGNIFIIILSFLIAIIFIDYNRLKETEQRLTKIVNIDTLTGVFSRKYFFDYVEAEIQRDKRFGICYIDIDRFKQVNDEYGHEIGDRLLCEIAKRMQDCVRKYDFVSRIGGDEFIIFISDINDEFDGKIIVNRLKEVIKEPVIYKNSVLQSDISIGYSIFPEDGSSIEELIQKADQHMYSMKEMNHRNKNH